MRRNRKGLRPLGKLEEAVNYYERVLVAEPATSTLESVEQLANLMVRLAASQKKPLAQTLQVMKRSTELLQNLSALGKTGERLALLGATAKRETLMVSGRARMQALKAMTNDYEEAHQLYVTNQNKNPWYPLANLIAGKLAMSWQRGAPRTATAGVANDMKLWAVTRTGYRRARTSGN